MPGELETLQAIVDANDQPVFAVDCELRYTAFNHAHATVMRDLYGAEIALGGRLLDYQTVQADREGALLHLQKALAGERVVADTVSGELERRVSELVHTPLTDSAGAVVGVVVRAYDLTDRRQAEHELRESEARYALLFESLQEGFAYARLLYDAERRPHDLVCLAVNPAFTRITGLQGVVGKRVSEVFPTMLAEMPEVFATFLAVVETGEPAELDIDFTPLGLYLHLSVLRPEPDHVAVAFTDITENRRAEQAVRDGEARFRGYFEQSLVGAAVTSPAKGWVEVNQATCDLLGYSREELSALSWAELTHPDDLAADVAQFERVIAGEIDEYLLEKRFVRKDGGVVYVDLSARCRRTPDGSVDYMLAILSDITERKRTDQVRAFLARTSSGTVKEPFFEALARYLAESLDMDFVCIDRLDGDGLIAHTVAVWCDGQFEDNVSYALKDTPCGDVVGNTVCCFPASVRQHFPRDKVLEDLRAESYVGVTLFDHGGRPIGLIAVISRHELVNRRAAETVLELVAVRAAAELEILDTDAELREMHERLDLAQRASGAGIWDWDVASGAIQWSPEMFELFGLDAKTVAAGFDSWNQALHPDDLEVANARIAAALADHALLDSDYRIVKPDGEVRWINAVGQGYYDEHGEPVRMTGICLDITERKKAEEELRETRDYLENLFGYANAPVIVWDPELRITRFNHAFEDLTQMSANDVVGHHLELLFPADERRVEALKHVTSATAGEHWQVVEIPILRADGEVRTVLWNSATVYAADGATPMATIAQGQDISERVAAERAVRESEEKFRSLFENMTEGVALHELALDEQGTPLDYRILDLNPAYETQTGVRAAQVRGKLSRDAYGTAEAPFLAEYASTAETGTPHRFHTYFAPLEKHFDITVVANGAGRFATVFQDITERKLAEEEIRRLNADLEQRVAERTRDLTAANAELEEFVHSIAHDLRSPLRALSGFSDIVQADYDDIIDDTGRDYLRRIHDAAHHLGDLMDALLSLSRISRQDLDLCAVDLSALARATTEQLRDAEPERAVEVDVADDLVARGDPALCEIIVQNLLGNAWKFSARETPARISFSAERVDGRRAFCVSDNGAGFDAAYSDKLFRPFERLHTADEFPGTGIGLATVRRAVGRLGGTCWAEGEPGGGARLYFSLGETT